MVSSLASSVTGAASASTAGAAGASASAAGASTALLKKNKGKEYGGREKTKTHGNRSRSLLNLGGLYLNSGGGSGLYRLDFLNRGNSNSSFRGRHY